MRPRPSNALSLTVGGVAVDCSGTPIQRAQSGAALAAPDTQVWGSCRRVPGLGEGLRVHVRCKRSAGRLGEGQVQVQPLEALDYDNSINSTWTIILPLTGAAFQTLDDDKSITPGS